MAIATVDKNVGRQYPLVAFQEISLSQLQDGVAVASFKLPPGARVIGGELVVSTAFNSTTSDTLSIGDAGSATRYASTANIHATGRTALTLTGYKHTAPTTITLTWASGGGTPTTGAAYIMMMYIVDGRANEVVPVY